ncbi:MAG: efflux RND transporter periplasmic adaptor subunit [Lachnospiraceae bacterium]|nr:efflux RND transporter periplasmic adaptor subunit [Lachnospiraceae bacterium]
MGNSKFIEDFEVLFEGEALYENGQALGSETAGEDYADEEYADEDYAGEELEEEYYEEEYDSEEYPDTEETGEDLSGEAAAAYDEAEEETQEEETQNEEAPEPAKAPAKAKKPKKAKVKEKAHKSASKPKPRKKNHLKKFLKIFIPLFILVAGALIGLYFYKLGKINAAKAMAESGVEMSDVQKQDISNSVAVTGSIVANKTRDVSTLVSNIKVQTVDVEVGDYVTKGDPICTFDKEAIEGKIERLQNEMFVTASKAQISQMEANTKLAWTLQDSVNSSIEKEEAVQAAIRDYNAAERNLGEMKKQLEEAQDKYDDDDSDANERALRQAELSVASAKDSVQSSIERYNSAIRAQEENTKQVSRTVSQNQESIINTNLDGLTTNDSSRTELTELERQLANCEVVAPISGVVTSISVAEGDEYSEKSTICVIQDDSIYKIKGTVDQYDIASIKEGQEAMVKTNATGDEQLEGTVTFVAIVPQSSSSSSGSSGSSGSSAASSATTSSTSYEVEITLKNKDPRLRIGMTAETSIIIDKRTGVYTVPYDCVETDPDGKTFVNVVEAGQASAEAGAGPDGSPEGKAGQHGPDSEYSGIGGFFKVIFSNPEMEAAMGGQAQSVPSRKVQVKVGLETDYYVEIISDEIEEGDQVLMVSGDTMETGHGFDDGLSSDHNDGGEEPF